MRGEVGTPTGARRRVARGVGAARGPRAGAGVLIVSRFTLHADARKGAAAAAEAKWRDLHQRYGTSTAKAVGAALGSTNKNVSDLASRKARDGELLAVKRGGAYFFPDFQFDPDTGAPAPGLKPVLDVFAQARWQPLAVALWFAEAQGEAEGNRPADLLFTDPGLVLRAARARTDPW